MKQIALSGQVSWLPLLDYTLIDFPSEVEPHIRINEYCDSVMITCKNPTPKALLSILVVNDALIRSGVKHRSLYMPYLPFARQDRVMVSGEPLSIKVFANLINSCKFDEVSVLDPHSEVASALIDNIFEIDSSMLYEDIDTDGIIISPDSGAYKKIYKTAKKNNLFNEIVICNKDRDVVTGNITGINCPVPDFGGKPLYIIDDICDGGGTFQLLAAELKKRNSGKITLIISHGIFSKGYDVFSDIDSIVTTDSFTPIFKYNEPKDLVTTIEL